MSGMNGMETAERIRTFDENLLIVFVTGYQDYVFDGYRVGALDYVIKPVGLQRLREVYDRVKHILKERLQETFIVKIAMEYTDSIMKKFSIFTVIEG